MRNSFPDLTAWEPGYSAMLSVLNEGRGHSPEAADKQGQKAIRSTGCAYSDTHLVPVLEAMGRFVDQEQLSP
jgi:hypothetical protein